MQHQKAVLVVVLASTILRPFTALCKHITVNILLWSTNLFDLICIDFSNNQHKLGQACIFCPFLAKKAASIQQKRPFSLQSYQLLKRPGLLEQVKNTKSLPFAISVFLVACLTVIEQYFHFCVHAYFMPHCFDGLFITWKDTSQDLCFLHALTSMSQIPQFNITFK